MYRYTKNKGYKTPSRTYSSPYYSGTRSSWALARRITSTSQAGTKRITVKTLNTFDGQFTFSANSAVSNVLQLRPTSGASLDQSTLAYNETYKAYAKLFDECRIIGCKAKISFGDAFTSSGTAPFMTFLTALDRKMIYNYSSLQPAGQNMTAAEIAASSSCIKTDFTVQQRLAAYRSFYAQTRIEKETFWDAYVATNTGMGCNYIQGLQQSVSAFNPTMYMCVASGVAPTSDTSLRFRIQVEWYLEFRNPKLLIPGSSKDAPVITFGAETPVGRETFSEVKNEPKEEEDMDPGTS